MRTSLSGLTEADAEERARTTGPNEIAQERKQGWFIRFLKITRNPLVILLTTLSVVSFLTGDARAGSVMGIMVVLSLGLRFWQEARADAVAQKLKAMIHRHSGDTNSKSPRASLEVRLVDGGHQQNHLARCVPYVVIFGTTLCPIRRQLKHVTHLVLE